MKQKQKGSALLIVLIIAILVIGARFYTYNKNSSVVVNTPEIKTSTTTNNLVPQTKTDVSEWSTYSHVNPTFSFRYPHGWVIQDKDEESTLVSIMSPENIIKRAQDLSHSSNITVNYFEDYEVFLTFLKMSEYEQRDIMATDSPTLKELVEGGKIHNFTLQTEIVLGNSVAYIGKWQGSPYDVVFVENQGFYIMYLDMDETTQNNFFVNWRF